MKRRAHFVHTLTLFSSFSTLFCCALPALFVLLGAGAVFAGIVSTVPQFVWLSEHKLWLFGFSACMLMVSGVLRRQARYLPCPMEAEKAEACSRTRKISGIVYWGSVCIFLTGGFFAFVAPRLMEIL
jgi:hypothetical protein